MTSLALTIHQPWAWAIVAGHKHVENRTWIPPRDFVGQWLFIHAGKTLDPDALAWVRAELGRESPTPVDLVTGSIVGCVRYLGTATHDSALRVPGIEVDDAQSYVDSPWYRGPFGWVLGDPVLFIRPVPARGRQKLWRPSNEDVEACRDQWRLSRTDRTENGGR